MSRTMAMKGTCDRNPKNSEQSLVDQDRYGRPVLVVGREVVHRGRRLVEHEVPFVVEELKVARHPKEGANCYKSQRDSNELCMRHAELSNAQRCPITGLDSLDRRLGCIHINRLGASHSGWAERFGAGGSDVMITGMLRIAYAEPPGRTAVLASHRVPMKFLPPPHGVIAVAAVLSTAAAVGGAVALGALGHTSPAAIVSATSPKVGNEFRHSTPNEPGQATSPPAAEAPGSQTPVLSKPSASHTVGAAAPIPTSTPRPTRTPTPAPSDGIIHTDGQGQLTLNGHPYQFVGVNAYELATWWGTNYGCGAQVEDLGGFFNALTPNSVVRFWAFQDFTQSKTSGGRDWGPIDRVVQAAERAHQRLIFVFGDQWANCHGEQYKDATFYHGAYKTAQPLGELEPYLDWVHDVVVRYRSSPAVGMWEPLNEAQGDCVSVSRADLNQFFDTVGALIKSIDPKHLIESGLLGTGQCAVTGVDYVVVQNTPNIDVLSYHDYGDASPVPSGLLQRLQQAQQLKKPLIVGEVGFLSDCATMKAKQPAQFAAGVSGFMPWNWDGAGASTCGF